jgi:hypothetical protein
MPVFRICLADSKLRIFEFSEKIEKKPDPYSLFLKHYFLAWSPVGNAYLN